MNPPTPAVGSLAHDPQAAALWEKLCRFSFDRGTGPRTFAQRLASEQGWSASFASLVIGEYRRYLLLFALDQQKRRNAPVRPGELSAVRIVPSEAVDKVWHLHLLYTQSYWEDLCRDILGGPLHHLPADGSGGEAAGLDAVYRDTLAVYRQTFGQDAPASVWPGAAPGKRPQPEPSVSKALVTCLVAIGIVLLFLFFQRVAPSDEPIRWFLRSAAVGGVLMAAAVIVRSSMHPGGADRRRAMRRAGLFTGSADPGAWSCSGTTSGDAGAYTHDTGGHHGGGAHDGGGHSHSCGGGGHSCGGHSCGGHGCGGH